MASPKVTAFVAVVVLMLAAAGTSLTQLSPIFDLRTCPRLHEIITLELFLIMQKDIRVAAKLMRLHFHDCFANGCDGSVLLEDMPGFIDSELNAGPNKGIKGRLIVERIEEAVERSCSGVVSCADILALSSQLSVQLFGGPVWETLLGRRDSRIANRTAAENIPGPSLTLDVLKARFAALRLNSRDLVALSGAHTFGKARCQFFNERFDNFNNTCLPDLIMNAAYREQLRKACTTPTTRANLDPTTPERFDNNYYKNLLDRKGLFPSDQELLSTSGDDTADIVNSFANSQALFFAQFGIPMVKMGNLTPPPGTSSEASVRVHCHRINPR